MKKLIVILIAAIGFSAVAQDSSKNLNVLAFNGLNMRSQPDSKARVVTKVAYGKQVEIIEKTDEGYVFGGYLGGMPAPIAAEKTLLEDLLPLYCSSNLKVEDQAINATENTRNGDTLFYTLQAFSDGVELELEQQGNRKTSKLLLPLNVQQTYVLLESMLKSSGNSSVIEQLRFVQSKDGRLTRIRTASGAVSIKAMSESQTAMKISTFDDNQSAQR